MRMSDWSSDVCASDLAKVRSRPFGTWASWLAILFTHSIVNIDSSENMTDNRLRIGGIRPPTGGRVCMKAQLFASASAAALFALPATAMAQSSEAAAPADTTAQGSARDRAPDAHDNIEIGSAHA